MHILFVIVGQQVGHLGHGFAGHDDADILHGGDRALHDGKAVAVQRHHSQLVQLDLEQLAGVGGFFLVLTDSVQGAFDHVPQHAGLDGQGLLRAGVGQIREIGGGHGLDLELCHAALDGGLAVIGSHDADLTCRHPADHAAEQLCIQYDLAGLLDVGFDGGYDAHFQIVAGQGELKTLGLQQNALQHRDGRAHGDSFGNAVDGCTEQRFIADDVQNSISPFFTLPAEYLSFGLLPEGSNILNLL